MAISKDLRTGTGRRKTATARVFLYEKGGDFTVNDKPIEECFLSEKEILAWQKPFHLVGVSHPQSKFTMTAKIAGSGVTSQLGALVHGISQALSAISEENRLILRKNGFLTRDSRMVERKKPYLRKARKAPQYSKR
jgi:small subunit ribosomal protein S9